MSSISSPKKLRRQLYFSQAELGAILSAYSARVAAGEWRDYALDHQTASPCFQFSATLMKHLFVIEKRQLHPKEAAQFLLRDRNRILCRSGQLADLINHFSKLPRLISG